MILHLFCSPVAPYRPMQQQIVRIVVFALSVTLLLMGCKDDIPTPPEPGPAWLTFTRESTLGLIHNRINAIALDGDGRIWFGTDSGASYFNRGRWASVYDSLTYRVYGSGGTSRLRAVVTAITEGRDGSIWFGTSGGGVRRYNRFATRKTWQRYDYPDIPSYFVSSIAAIKTEDPGDVWVTSQLGATYYRPNQTNPEEGYWTYVTSPPLPTPVIYSTYVNPVNNTIIFGTKNGFTFLNRDGAWRSFSFPPGFDYPVIAIDFDPISNTVLFGKHDGASSFNMTTTEVRHYNVWNTQGKLPPGYVRAVAIDLEATQWFGTERGLVRLKDTTWTTFDHVSTPELPSDTVSALRFDKKGNLWIGTYGGVAVYNPDGTRF